MDTEDAAAKKESSNGEEDRRADLPTEEADRRSPMSADRYLKERVEQYQGWYDAKARMAKRRHQVMRSGSVLAGAIVPVLANVQGDLATWGTTLLSLLVVILVSLESVLHYREQWKNYRSTEQFLGHERFTFQSGVGPYRDKSPDEGFQVFVERVESAIAAENASTLNVMTLAGQVTGDEDKFA